MPARRAAASPAGGFPVRALLALFGLAFPPGRLYDGFMKIVLPLLGGTFALLLSSCGSCSCNSYDRDLLYDVKPTTSKSF